MNPPGELQATEVAEAITIGLGHRLHGGGLAPMPARFPQSVDASASEAAAQIARAMLEANSADAAAHSDDVDVIAEGLCRELGIYGRRRRDILLAARLHDIGKIAMPKSILEKPGGLDADEWKAIHTHTEIGDEILRSVPALASVAKLVRSSHERWDGDGYPDGLAGDDIPLGSRIIFCADAFHAIRCDRVYRRGRSAKLALKEIQAGAGSQFDPRVVEAFTTLIAATRERQTRKSLLPRSKRLAVLLLVVSAGSAVAKNAFFPADSKQVSPVGVEASASPAAGGEPAAPREGSIGSCAGPGCASPRRSEAVVTPSVNPAPSATNVTAGPGRERITAPALNASSNAAGSHGTHSPGGSGQGAGDSGPVGGSGTSGNPPAVSSNDPSAAGDPLPGSPGTPIGHGHGNGNGNAYGHSGGKGNPNPGSGGNAYGHSGGNGTSTSNSGGNGNGNAVGHSGSSTSGDTSGPLPTQSVPTSSHGNPHATPVPAVTPPPVTLPAVPSVPGSVKGGGHGNSGS